MICRILVFGDRKTLTMKALEQLKNRNPARLIPPFKKNERRLLSIVMALLDVVPSLRGSLLACAGYGAGKTSRYQHYMEPEFNGLNTPPGRPDGLLICTRGKTTWSALVEAKSEGNHIDAEQVQRYIQLGAYLGVDCVITISNELSLTPTELPFYLAANKRKGRTVAHFSWLSIITEINLLLENGELDEIEQKLLIEALAYFQDSGSGVQAFNQMPKDWADFVSSANAPLGFNKSTPGVREIVLSWQQLRRHLLLRVIQELGFGASLSFNREATKDTKARDKQDLTQLVNDYSLSAQYAFSGTPDKLSICADLRACLTKITFTTSPPAGKQAKATITWLLGLLSSYDDDSLEIMLDWPHLKDDVYVSLKDLRADPEIGIQTRRDAPQKIQLTVKTQSVRTFKSRKKFVEGLEHKVLGFADFLRIVGLV